MKLLVTLVVVFLCTFIINVQFVNYINPHPVFHDELSNLLAADTFASGKITNPPNKFAKFFDTFHVIQSPTYMSKYPPGNALFMAFGKLLFGKFIYGVSLQMALAAMCLYWMLSAWFSTRWSLFGTALVALNPTVMLSWGACYWGGGVVLLGAALATGALLRMSKEKALLNPCLLYTSDAADE